MKKKAAGVIFVSLFFLSLSLIAFTSCAKKTETSQIPNTATAATAEVYTCPMHPEVVSDKPEKCPKCGMDLVVKDLVAKAKE